jgi:hypothetical protein
VYLLSTCLETSWLANEQLRSPFELH